MTTPNFAKLVKTLRPTTNGKGWWSDQKRAVNIKKIEIESIANDNGDEIDFRDKTQTPNSMYIRVFFLKKSWNVEKHGLIYTDKKWLTQLRKGLREIGVTATGLYYTEQGMQGDDYVSMSIYKSPKTIAAFIKAFT